MEERFFSSIYYNLKKTEIEEILGKVQERYDDDLKKKNLGKLRKRLKEKADLRSEKKERFRNKKKFKKFKNWQLKKK